MSSGGHRFDPATGAAIVSANVRPVIRVRAAGAMA